MIDVGDTVTVGGGFIHWTVLKIESVLDPLGVVLESGMTNRLRRETFSNLRLYAKSNLFPWWRLSQDQAVDIINESGVDANLVLREGIDHEGYYEMVVDADGNRVFGPNYRPATVRKNWPEGLAEKLFNVNRLTQNGITA